METKYRNILKRLEAIEDKIGLYPKRTDECEEEFLRLYGEHPGTRDGLEKQWYRSRHDFRMGWDKRDARS